MTSTAILIPARYNSARFPGKPLAMLDGVPMIKRVYDACIASKIPTYVLTDDMRIFELFNTRNCWIDEAHYENGTERCAGAIKNDFFKQYDQFINVQGDMPDVTLEMIEKTKWHLQHYPVTTMCAMMPEKEQNDPNTVKLVRAADKCLWFGRGIVGYGDWHLGIYGYKRNSLEMYPSLFSTREERLEGLEQLRWLKGGWDIGVFPCEFNGIEINTPEDAEKWNDSR
jgi:3-deoxy-manno-octulosonate cytidylyltransferase (CMP-KDO synthetase)